MIDHRIGKIKVRRGTDFQRKLVTFEEGELVYSIDKKRLYIGNGTESGGILVSNRNYVKNSVGNPPVVPIEAVHGDIVYDKSDSKTYITKCNSLSCELILIADASCCARLQIEIDDLYNRLRTLLPCATSFPPPPPPTKLSWYIQPSDISVNLSQTATFTASAIGGFGAITYKWNRKDGIPISVVDNQPTLTITTQLSDTATYYCVANTFTETITSKDAVLNIGSNSILAEDGTYVLSELNEFIDWETSGLIAPTITIQPRSQSTTTLVPVTFEVTATGSAPLSYQWKINGVNIAGETNRTYTVTNPTKDITGINCIVSNLVGSVPSNFVNLSVGIKPTIITQPVSQSVSIGSSATFSVIADGTNPLNYQWNKNGNLINGATNSTYTINSVTTNDFADYNCVVSNIYESVTSNNANLKNNIFDSSDIIISTNTSNFVLKDALIAKGWDQILPVRVNVIVNSGVIVGSNSTTLPAFKVDVLPKNSIINLINNGTITGRGGDGGAGGYGTNGEDGLNGGTGIYVLYSINIQNNGIIGGGGGGGGGGVSFRIIPGNGTKGIFDGIGGNGGTGVIYVLGGSGGNIGENGIKGSDWNAYILGGAGGLAGYYIDGISFVTWITKGDVKGRVK